MVLILITLSLLDDLHANIKRITDSFFAARPIVDFLGAFVRDENEFQSPKDLFEGCLAHGVVDSERPQRLAPTCCSWTYRTHLHPILQGTLRLAPFSSL
ncbi:MAG: hypothetical protein J3Q66DRAFT_443728 [Benniella sp.]|nr:MAG: hypothetical protein J3Q66DRAFT_443728 [Benniella sp.]